MEDESEKWLELARQLIARAEDMADLFEANELCNRALKKKPRCEASWLVKSQVMLHMEDGASALSAVEMVLREGRRCAEAYYLQAAALSQMERFDEALAAITHAFKCIRTGQEDPRLLEELYYEKAVILDAVDRRDEALATFEAGLRRFPESELLRAGIEPLRRQKLRSSFLVLDGGLA